MESNQNFKKSEIVENIKQRFKNDKFEFLDNKEGKSNFVDVNKANVHKVLDTICNSWNKDTKARNFIKHIIGAFYGISSFNKILQFSEEDLSNKKNKCALLGIWLCGIKDIADFGASMLLDRAKLDVAYHENESLKSEESKKKLDQTIAEYNEKLKAFPIAVRNRNFAYFSEKSDKFLSNEAVIALQLFTQEAILLDEREVTFTLNKRRINHFNKHKIKNNKLSKAEVNKVAKANTFGVFDESTLNKLMKVKEELENSED